MDSRTDDDYFIICQKLIEINKIKIISMDEMKLSKIDKDIIGLGGQAVVYHGLYGDIPVAVKVLTEIDWKSLSNELIIIANIVHDNIPKFYGMIIENSKIEMVFEYVEGKTLDNFSEKCFAYFSDNQNTI